MPLLALLLLALIAPQSATLPDAGATVLVQARENGQGILRARGAECFVVTPSHVVDGAAGAIRIVGERSAQTQAVLLRQFPGDVTVLRVENGTSMPCAEWPAIPDLKAMIRGRDTGTLSFREADGTRTLMP